MSQSKNPAAVSLGRLGGKAGTGASKRRDPEHYRTISLKAAAARRKKAKAK